MVKRIRGTACSVRVSPAIANRIVESAKGVLLKFIPDVYIYADHCKKSTSGKSPGIIKHLSIQMLLVVLHCIKFYHLQFVISIRFWNHIDSGNY